MSEAEKIEEDPPKYWWITPMQRSLFDLSMLIKHSGGPDSLSEDYILRVIDQLKSLYKKGNISFYAGLLVLFLLNGNTYLDIGNLTIFNTSIPTKIINSVFISMIFAYFYTKYCIYTISFSMLYRIIFEKYNNINTDSWGYVLADKYPELMYLTFMRGKTIGYTSSVFEKIMSFIIIFISYSMQLIFSVFALYVLYKSTVKIYNDGDMMFFGIQVLALSIVISVLMAYILCIMVPLPYKWSPLVKR